jgi:large repetitive protein
VLVTPELAPKVVSSLPEQGAGQIDPRLKQIKFSFNESVNVSANGVSLKCNTTTVALSGLPSNNSSVLLLSWSVDLPETATCLLTIKKAAIEDSDLADGPNQLEFDYILAFSTTDQAPMVVSHTPVNNANAIASNSKIKLSFSENVDLSVDAVTLQCPLGSPIALNGLPVNNISEVELTPVGLLPSSGGTCVVTVHKDQLSDSDSIDPPNSLATNYSFSFLLDSIPSVTAATPTAGSTNGIATAVSISFSEPVTLDNDAVGVVCASLGLPTTTTTPAFSSSLSADGLILSILPAPKWPEAANCSVTLDKNKLHDSDNIDPPDQLAENFTLSFQTDASPRDIALAPSAIAENQPSNTTVGNLSTIDLGLGQSYSYSLVAGSGDNDNGSFVIVGNSLQTNTSFDFEAKNSHTIRIRSNEIGMPLISVEKIFVINMRGECIFFESAQDY